jgi:phage-related protein
MQRSEIRGGRNPSQPNGPTGRRNEPRNERSDADRPPEAPTRDPAPDSPRSCHQRTKNGTVTGMTGAPIIDVVFFRTESGQEPVRDWLKSLSKADKRVIGADLKTVQYGWPIGMPVVRKLEAGLREVRSHLDRRIARILFTVTDGRMILLHGFIKKSQKTPADDLALARRRRSQLTPGPHSP